jgi:monovalent cation:H+ antiporter, CPA1 family
MELFFLFSVLITLAAVFSYFNVRVLKLPQGISLMLMGTLVSIGVVLAGTLSVDFTTSIKHRLSTIDFSEFILGILLSFLLFAGSLHVKFDEIKSYAKSIVSFATAGTVISTFLVGAAVYYLLPLFHIHFSLISCLLFGALISPTDPVAVIGILKKANLSKPIEVRVTGESLFNDGIGVVIFATILEIAMKGIENFSFTSVLLLFTQEAIGGILAGLLIGYAGFKMMKAIDHFQTEILISLAMVMGGYTLCHYLHVSGPLAMVVAGLVTGNKGRREAMSDTTRDYLEKFWEVTDEVLNAILFMLIGLELVIVSFEFNYILIGLITAFLIVAARYISLWIPAFLFRFKNGLEKHTLVLMTWGGLRGGISIALALSLPNEPYKSIFVPVTFIIVLFSVLVQGFSMGRLIKMLTVKKGS